MLAIPWQIQPDRSFAVALEQRAFCMVEPVRLYLERGGNGGGSRQYCLLPPRHPVHHQPSGSIYGITADAIAV